MNLFLHRWISNKDNAGHQFEKFMDLFSNQSCRVGIRIRKVLPFPVSLITFMVPLCNSAISLQMDKPSPLPEILLVYSFRTR